MSATEFDARNCWKFPACLFGDTKTTRRRFTKIAQKAISEREWRICTSADDCCDIRDSESAIVVRRALRGYAPDRAVPLWRPYWVASLFELIDDGSLEPNDKQAAHLILEGMRSLWFTVGMLSFGPWFRRRGQPRALLERYVHWLPELELLSPRFRAEGQEGEMFWTVTIMGCAFEAGYVSPTEHEQLNARENVRSAESFLAWLLEKQIILPDGARYRLAPEPASGPQ